MELDNILGFVTGKESTKVMTASFVKVQLPFRSYIPSRFRN